MKQCQTCKNFVQHFIIDKDLGIRPAHCGHCMEGKRMSRTPCPIYEQGDNRTLRDNNFPLAEKLFRIRACLYESQHLANELSKELKKEE